MKNLTILVIEDNPMNMKLFRSLLSLGKFNVLEAGDAKNGIELSLEHKPDLILMDIQLPGMDGLSATRIIKENPVLNSIPIVALTAHAMMGDEEKAKAAGCDGYISKPINTKKFLGEIEKFLQEKTNKEKHSERRNICYKNKILIVDDEPLNVKLLAAKLPPDQYDIIKAYNGIEALQKVSEAHPNLILLDIMMPEVNGYEVARRMKENPETRDIPIIMVTALNDREDKIKAFERGAEEFISKPVNSIELQKRIKSTLCLKQYHEQISIRRQSEESFFVSASEEYTIKDTEIVPTILIVEDNEKDVKLLQGQLHSQPYRLLFATNGEEALTLIQEEKVDLILQDILLPGMNGFDVCLRIKEMEETNNIQIVLITCLHDLENKVRGTELDVDDYLVKPINGQELRFRITTLLKKKRYLDKLCFIYEKDVASVTIDGLTRLYNYHYFERFITLVVKSALKNNYPVSLILIDIDEQKQHHEILGNFTRDAILRELTKVMRRNIREIDLPTRYGSHEFAIVLPYCLREEAQVIAERIQKSFVLHSLPHEEPIPTNYISLRTGVASIPTDASTTEELVKSAEQMLHSVMKEEKSYIIH